MKRILFIIAALFATAQSQTIQTIGAPTTTVVSRGNFRTDSIFYLPKRQKLPTDSGAVRYQISDSSVYYWSGYQWLKLGVNIDTSAMLSPYVRGSGTANYLPKFNGSRSIVDSKVYETGTNLLFNTITPSVAISGYGTFDLNGTAASLVAFKKGDTARGYIGHNGTTMDINNTQAGDIRFYTSSTLRGRFQTDGTFRLNSLTGTGTRSVVADANGVLSASSTPTDLIDTTYISTRAWRQKGDDSLGAIIATKGSGTVTSVATGYGLSGGTITTTGTIIVDSAIVASRLRVGKVVDSLALVKQNVLTNPVTGTGTTNYVPKFTGTSTIGNSQIFDDGEVKINTTGDSGNYKLQVNGSILSNTDIAIRSNTPRIFFSDADNNGDHFIQGDGNSLLLYADNLNKADNSAIKFYVDNVQQMILTKDGYLGIGNNSPETKVEIAIPNSGAIATALQVKNYAFAVNANGEGVQIGFANNRNFGSVNSSTITSTTSNFSNGASDLYFSTWSGSSLVERFRTTANGELLLNTTLDAGDYKLQVSGNAYVTGTTVLAATSGNVQVGATLSPWTWKAVQVGTAALSSTSTVGFVSANAYFDGSYKYVANGAAQVLEVNNANEFRFLTASSGTAGNSVSFTQAMTLTNNSELILNTTTDAGDYKLQVSGNAYVTGTTVLAATSGNVAIGGTTASFTTDITGTLRSTGNTFLSTASNETVIGGTSDRGAYTFQVLGNVYVEQGAIFAANSGDFGIGGTPLDKLTIIQDQNSSTSSRVRNSDAGSSAYAMVGVNASGNSWGMRMGSSAANSNALEFVVDAYGTPSAKIKLHTSGGLRFIGQSAAPTAEAGTVYYDTDDNKLKVYNGTTWVDLH
jgi:hypothetical protein